MSVVTEIGATDRYSAVLIPRNLGLRSITIDGKRCSTLEASALPFFVEELIGQGAIHLAVDRGSPYYDGIDLLPEMFRKRIRKVDSNGRCLQQMIAVMRPVIPKNKMRP